jgi:predicted TPR repeat methyltransferase
MKNPFAYRFWVSSLLLSAAPMTGLTPVLAAQAAPAAMQASPSVPQAAPAATQSLLDKAHALEVRGRMDMAAQTWQQVLLADPNNTEALGGLARAARLSGNMPLAQTYIERRDDGHAER